MSQIDQWLTTQTPNHGAPVTAQEVGRGDKIALLCSAGTKIDVLRRHSNGHGNTRLYFTHDSVTHNPTTVLVIVKEGID